MNRINIMKCNYQQVITEGLTSKSMKPRKSIEKGYVNDVFEVQNYDTKNDNEAANIKRHVKHQVPSKVNYLEQEPHPEYEDHSYDHNREPHSCQRH